LLLIDCLSEDLVEISDNSLKRAHYKDSNYDYPKITIFQELSDNEPFNTIFAPMTAESPTATTIRVKGIMTGAFSSLIEGKDNFKRSSI